MESNVASVMCAGDGDLFLWGSNKHGQLTTTEPFLSSPTLVNCSLLGGEKVVHVWSGWTHTVAQTGETRRHALCLRCSPVLARFNRSAATSEQSHHPFQRPGECSHGAEQITDNWAVKHQPVRTQSSRQWVPLTSLQRLKSSKEQHR